MKNRSVVLLSIILSLAIGVFIYGITRTESIYLNQWLGQVGNGKVLDVLQGLVQNSQIPDWIIYSLPDALWMLALSWVILLIWDFKINSRSIPWISFAILFGGLLETLQGFHFVPGTFDMRDLLFMFIGAVLPVSFTSIKIKRKKNELMLLLDPTVGER